MIPTTRADAKIAIATHYFTGKNCRNGHVEPRFTRSGVCMACARTKTKKWVGLNRDKYLDRKTISNAKNADKNRQYASDWREKYPSKKNASESIRRAICRQQTPTWVDQTQVFMWYEVANILSRGGVTFHVDHIFPLRGTTVCGLNSHDNLQILPWHLNLKKGNKNGN